MKKTHIAIYVVALVFAVFITYRTAHHDYYNAITVTGATPVAVAKKVPADFSLAIDGMVKKTYKFSSSAMRAFATTRIRTKEITPGGDFQGTYIYAGIPVLNILEGIAPAFPDESLVNTPTDFLVTFTSDSGQTVHFSYGELVMTDDNSPVTLAYYREQLLPSSSPETYTINVHKTGLQGFRLIAPSERDTLRYLDNVVKVTLSIPAVHNDLLPQRRKNYRCAADDITLISQDNVFKASFQGVENNHNDEWIRVGHGQGYKGTSSVEGYYLKSFLKKNLPECRFEDYFLFVSCDGYRCLFSGREIFETRDGANMIIIKKMDGKHTPAGNMVACINDYFIDRSIWGVTHIVVLTPDDLQASRQDTL